MEFVFGRRFSSIQGQQPYVHGHQYKILDKQYLDLLTHTVREVPNTRSELVQERASPSPVIARSLVQLLQY